MRYKPFQIFLDGRELQGWTSAKLERRKENLTGSLTVEIFFSYIPSKPVFVEAVRGKEITAYVGGQLAFTGILDKRTGKSVQARDERGRFTSGTSGPSDGFDVSGSLSDKGYSVTLTARGKTKYLIDSSHQHPKNNMIKTNNQDVVKKLTEFHEIDVEWMADKVDLNKIRFRDGGRIVDEIHRITNETCCFAYETREGKLRVIDGPGASVGEALVLGQNILDFSAEQSEDQANSEITVKGQRTDNDSWGEDAVLKRIKTIKDGWVQSKIPLTIQHYGDATDEALERRGKFEADKRATESKSIEITVFHVQPKTSEAWDLGLLHYTEIPPEGVFDVMECTGIVYDVQAEGTLSTTLTLSPPPSTGVVGGAGFGSGGVLGVSLPGLADAVAMGVSRRRQLGVSIVPGNFPSSWGSADLFSVLQDLSKIAVIANTLLTTDQKPKPPLKLPESFMVEDDN